MTDQIGAAAARGHPQALMATLAAELMDLPVMTARQAGILLHVYLHDGAISQGELAASTGVQPYVITRAVGVYERLGYVRRVREAARMSSGKMRPPKDIMITRTPAGQAVVDAMSRRMHAAIRTR